MFKSLFFWQNSVGETQSKLSQIERGESGRSDQSWRSVRKSAACKETESFEFYEPFTVQFFILSPCIFKDCSSLLNRPVSPQPPVWIKAVHFRSDTPDSGAQNPIDKSHFITVIQIPEH